MDDSGDCRKLQMLPHPEKPIIFVSAVSVFGLDIFQQKDLYHYHSQHQTWPGKWKMPVSNMFNRSIFYMRKSFFRCLDSRINVDHKEVRAIESDLSLVLRVMWLVNPSEPENTQNQVVWL